MYSTGGSKNFATKRQRLELLLASVPLNWVTLGDVSSVGSGVSEMRIHYGPGYRVYFTVRSGQLMILLIGGDKSSQSKDIAKAKVIATELSKGK